LPLFLSNHMMEVCVNSICLGNHWILCEGALYREVWQSSIFGFGPWPRQPGQTWPTIDVGQKRLIIVRRVAEVEQINFVRFNYCSSSDSYFPVRHTSWYNLRAINSPALKVMESWFNYLNEFTFGLCFSFLTLSDQRP